MTLLELFDHPELPKPKRDPRGRVKLASGREVEWWWEKGSLHMVIDDPLHREYPDNTVAFAEGEVSEASSKIPAFVNKLHDEFWAKYGDLAERLKVSE